MSTKSKSKASKALETRRRLERKMKRLLSKIEEIESTIYKDPEEDPYNQHFLLQQRRNHAIRGVVLELQLAIEDLLNVWLKSYVLRCKPTLRDTAARKNPKLALAIDQLLEGSGSINFERKLDLAEGTGLIRKTEHERLRELYKIRNKCSHHWLLNEPVRRKIKRSQPKRRLVEYRNKNLFDVAILKDFAGEYGTMYYKLFLKVYA